MGEEQPGVIVIGRVACRPGQREQLLALMTEMQERSREEEGCIRYGFFEAVGAENEFVAVEEWATREALDRHFARPHLQDFVRGLPDAIAERPSVALHEIASTGPFPGTGAT
jgi:quinol monooxygenase YgiN